MELAPPVSGVVFICIFWTVLFCIIIIVVLFILGFTLFFIHLVFRTHVSSCVHGGIKHPKSVLIILGCNRESAIERVLEKHIEREYSKNTQRDT
jgi:hypothetical protein